MDLQIDADLQANTIIHIGFSKCASKTLQNLFTVHESLTCINFHHTVDLLIPQPSFLWNGERARNGFSQLLAEARELGTVPVISNEQLTSISDVGNIALRLHALMPGARVLMCIREQFSALTSVYKHAVRHGCTRTPREYLTMPGYGNLPNFYWEIFWYYQIIELYQTLFGKERVCVKLVEELRDSPEKFFADIYRFMGVEPCPSIDIHEVHHAGISDLETARRRLLNFYSVEPSGLRDPNPFDGMPINELLKKDIERTCEEMTAASVPSVEAEVRALFQGRFAASNRELSTLIGVDLAAFGYEAASETAGSAEKDVAGERFELEPIRAGGDYLEHTIVKYQGILYAFPYALGEPDLRFMSQEVRDTLLQDRDRNTLKQKIFAHYNRISVVDEAYHGYKIVRYRERCFAVPLTVSVVDASLLQTLIETGSADTPDWFVGVSEAECRTFIDDLIALQWLEQRPVYQPLHGELTDFVTQHTPETADLFGLPAAETWAFFRLLWHNMRASAQHDASSIPTAALFSGTHSITNDTLLDCALQSSPSQPWSFAAYANQLQSVLLRDTPASNQVALSKVQLEYAQGNWETAKDLLCQMMEQVKTMPGGFAAVLIHLAALAWVQRLFPVEALNSRIASRTCAFLRDVTISFLQCPPVQRALVCTWQSDAASQAFAYVRLGEALFTIDHLTGAEAAFRAASNLTPDNAAVHNNLAVLYWHLAQQTQECSIAQQALIHLERALQLDPTNADALVNAQVIVSGLEVKAA